MFQSKVIPSGIFGYFEALNQKGVQHCVTTKFGPDRRGFNLSYVTGNKDAVKANREVLAEEFGIPADKLFFGEQKHTNNIQVIKETGCSDNSCTDGWITNVKGHALAVMGADCPPILFFDPVSESIGAVHAGWKGTVAQIASKAVEMMESTYGAKPENIIACIGPSISGEIYEVGDNVISEVQLLIPETEGILLRKGDRTHLDLWALNTYLLTKAGVLSQNIHCAKTCTYQNSDTYYSARKEGFETGRFAAVIALN